MKRLLFVVNDAGFFLSHRLPVAIAAREAGWEVHVAAPADAAAGRIVAAGFTHHAIPLTRSGMHPYRELRLLVSIARLFRRLRPSLVHLVSIKPVLYGGLAARMTGVPAAVSAVSGLGHMFLGNELRIRLLRAVAIRAYRAALGHHNMRVVFQNPDDIALFEELRLVDPSRAVLIRSSGVDPVMFAARPEPAPPLVAMLPARLLSTKGVHEFVQAARILRPVNREWRFVLVGAPDPGNPATCREEDVRKWVDEGIVESWGHRDDMPETLARAHVVCLPSYREGFPKVLLEAAACGRAVVTSDVPGCREAVEDGVTGLLVTVRDPAALAGAIRRLFEDAGLRTGMGRRGRTRVETEFSAEKVASAHLDIYRRLA
jgi:glycosyltransferase involved in cell wall biosynthesis